MTIQEPGAGSQPVPPSIPQPTPPQSQSQSQADQPFVGTEKSPKPTRNVIALIALIVAIVGFIFACIPGALILGWILLPIAFILSIVSLFVKGRGKGLGVAALIISIIGTIVGVVVFIGVVSTSVDDAFGGSDVVIDAPATSEDAAEEAPADAPAAEAGTRENPVALGTAISSDEWTVVVNSYNPDGGAVVAAANQFNDAAPAGSHYGIVNYTVTYTGAESAYSAEVMVDMVTSAGNVVNSYDSIVSLSDGFGLGELFNGASATGSAAFVVPDGDAPLIRVQAGFVADEIFVKP